jgi:Domain of unknown function (DUF4760)
VAAAKTATTTNELVFGMASLSEVEAILITATLAALLATWGVITQRLVTRRLTTVQRLTELEADLDMINARKLFNTLSAAGGKLSTYTQASDLSDDESDAVRLVLNDFELTSLGIQFGILDFRIVRLFQRSTVLRDWTRAAPFVYKLRAEIGNPYIYYEFESLAHWFQENRRPTRRIWPRLWF